jgi:hypothetical protein
MKHIMVTTGQHNVYTIHYAVLFSTTALCLDYLFQSLDGIENEYTAEFFLGREWLYALYLITVKILILNEGS